MLWKDYEKVEHNVPVCILRCVASAPLLRKALEKVEHNVPVCILRCVTSSAATFTKFGKCLHEFQ